MCQTVNWFAKNNFETHYLFMINCSNKKYFEFSLIKILNFV